MAVIQTDSYCSIYTEDRAVIQTRKVVSIDDDREVPMLLQYKDISSFNALM